MVTAPSLTAATLTTLVEAASAAPSLHNSQPWRFRLDPVTATLELWAAPERGLPRIDPRGRALHLSVGAALFNVRTAAAHLGWRTEVTLLPDPREPRVLATVALRAGRDGPALSDPDPHELHELHAALWRRHTSRLPFTRRPSAHRIAELVRAAEAEGATLTVPDAVGTARVLRLTAEAERRDTRDRARRVETAAWVRRGTGDGLPPTALGPGDANGLVPTRDFAGPDARHPRATAAFEERPLIALLATRHDRRVDWLRAGQALERVWLTATARTLRLAPLHQALEWPDLRAALADPAAADEAGAGNGVGSGGGAASVQLVVRIGYGPAGVSSPRRSTWQVVERRG